MQKAALVYLLKPVVLVGLNGFDKTRRLLTKENYNAVFETAKKITSSDFLFLYRLNTIGHARLGLALSKKMIRKAHDRNRLKRMLRETFRLQTGLPPVDVIVLAKFGVGNKEHTIVRVNLEKSWNKLISCCVE